MSAHHKLIEFNGEEDHVQPMNGIILILIQQDRGQVRYSPFLPTGPTELGFWW
jgi:hypothetical protein